MERLQNILSQRGIASRRHAAEIIEAGRVQVNAVVVTEPGFRVDFPHDQVLLDGAPLPEARERPRTILIYKPRGVICSADDAQGETVCDLVRDLPERLVPVGRLDKESEGLLLMSNDGALINNLTHPRYGHAKRYEVQLAGHLTPEKLAVLRGPMEIDGYAIRPVEIEILHQGRNHVHLLEFILREGRNRQIRNMCKIAGFTVLSLRRVAIGALTAVDLRPGEWRDLNAFELGRLTGETPQFNNRPPLPRRRA